MSTKSQLGLKAETTYGTPVTVDRFFYLLSESITEDVRRDEADEFRPSGFGMLAANTEGWIGGHSGPVSIHPRSKGFGLLLQFLLGSIASAGPGSDSEYTYTGTPGSLVGDALTMQVNRPFHPSGTNQAHTFAGCKITGWTFSIEPNGYLTLEMQIDARAKSTATALASASFPAGAELFHWSRFALTYASGTALPVERFELSANLNLATDDRKMNNTTLKEEPTQEGWYDLSWSAVINHSALTWHDIVNSTSDQYSDLVATVTAPTAIGGTTFPHLEFTLPAARFDEPSPTMTDKRGLRQTIGGPVHEDGSNDLITIEYVTADTTA